MGCDIHTMIEYKAKDRDWQTFSYDTVNLGRDYRMFTAMADVRNYSDDFVPIEAKGLPEDVSHYTISANSFYVVDGDTEDEGSVSRADAERWVRSGDSEWTNDKKWRVTDPDAHSHSYLSPEEFEQCIEKVSKIVSYTVDPDYKVALAMLKKYKELGYESRIVFWFDN